MVKIVMAAKEDEVLLRNLAIKLDLDSENIHWEEFVKAIDRNILVGFGRLRRYNDFTELATLGIIENEQHKGIGTMIVNKLIEMGPKEIFVTCVITDFFKRFGFIPVKEYPLTLQNKINFCKCYGYKDDEVFIMKLIK